MSQSALLKKMVSRKIQNKYAFILYKQQYNNPSKSTTLKICHSYQETSFFILQYYINELCKTRTVICPTLLELLNSKKSIQTKINAIILEYNNLFCNNLSQQYFKINEFKFKLVRHDNIIYHKILRKQFKQNNSNIQFTLRNYNYFYKHYFLKQ